MRKSTREVRKPIFFTVGDASEEARGTVSADRSDDEDGGSEDFARSTKRRKTTTVPAKSLTTDLEVSASDEIYNPSSLFGGCVIGICKTLLFANNDSVLRLMETARVLSSVKPDVEVRGWLDSYKVS